MGEAKALTAVEKREKWTYIGIMMATCTTTGSVKVFEPNGTWYHLLVPLLGVVCLRRFWLRPLKRRLHAEGKLTESAGGTDATS